MKFSKQVTELILDGGCIVDNHTTCFSISPMCKTILIRMPKGKYIQDIRPGQEDNLFEYVYCQNFGEDDTLDLAGWKSGSLAEVKKKTREEHEELSHSFWQKDNYQNLRNFQESRTIITGDMMDDCPGNPL